ncbi:hypothetical protein GOV09_05445 [Candidatus Woesearchaeota archaeon]|nr:hypothetical protein [Candidatus Woesearchaeota archaeon]
MRWLIALLILMTACTQYDEQLAQRYKLDLTYHDYASKFIQREDMQQAENACKRTVIARNECFMTIVQHALAQEKEIPERWCGEIHPEEKLAMTQDAFEEAYIEIDDTLQQELDEQLDPSQQRIATLQQIKEDCYAS